MSEWKNDKDLTIGFMGDVMLGRLVNERISKMGYDYPWGNILPVLKGNDLNILNLENGFTNSTEKVIKVFNFKANPDRVQCLKRANIQLVNLANNHVLDFSVRGLKDTLDILDKAGVNYVGAGINSDQSEQAWILKCKGLKVGMIGCTDNEPDWKATLKTPGTNYIDFELDEDLERLLKNIREAKENSDLLIVSVHWGPNMRERPYPHFISAAHKMIDSGADIIHGHSAHVFHGIERYKKKLILYDAGDFIDDYAVDRELRNDRSFLFLVGVNAHGIKNVKLIPVLIGNMQVNIAPEHDRSWLIAKIQNLSMEFGTVINEQGEVVFP